MKNFDVDSTSLKIFPCLTHTQTFDRRPFPMYSQHELCRWKNTTSAPWACLKTHVVFLAQCDAQLMSKNKLWEWIAAIDIISYKSNLRFGTTSLRAWHRSGQTSVQTLIIWWEFFKNHYYFYCWLLGGSRIKVIISSNNYHNYWLLGETLFRINIINYYNYCRLNFSSLFLSFSPLFPSQIPGCHNFCFPDWEFVLIKIS